MRTFTIDKNPLDDVVSLFGRSALTINPGLTVLVGCNGTGKTTLLRVLNDQLRKEEDVLVMYYDDRTEGGIHHIGSLLFRGYTGEAAATLCSSEGEKISQSLGRLIAGIKPKLRKIKPKELWLLLDAVGSGLSLDCVAELKEFVPFLQQEEPEITVYVVAATNEFEFANGSDCIDVTSFQHKTFKTYDAYRKFILKTREKKDERYEKMNKIKKEML